MPEISMSYGITSQIVKNVYQTIVEGEDMTAFITGSEVNTGDTLDSAIIYARVISLGTLPNNGTKNVAHSITGLLKVLGLEILGDNGSSQYLFTYAASTYAHVLVNNTNISFITNTNWTAYTGICTVFYTRS